MTERNGRKGGYRSPLREAQAETTRRSIIDAAARLFGEQGYAGTSIDQIALAAGVSRATVFNAAGSKATLLKLALDVAIVGDDEPVALADRPGSQAIRAEPDVRTYLRRYAGLVSTIGARLAPLTEAARSAADADPEAGRLWHAHEAQRRVGAAHVIADVIRKGRLRKGLGAAHAADIVWVLNDPRLYHQLVLERGWSASTFTSWLADTMQQQLLG